MKKAIVSSIFIFCLFLLQSTLSSMFNIGSIKPNLLIIAVASLGFLGGKRTGIYAGFLSGLLVDVCFRSVYGMNALIYMYIGFVCGFFKKVLFPKDIKLPLLFIVVSDLAYNVFYYFFLFFFRGKFDFIYYLKHIMLPEAVYTAIMACVFYPFIHYVMKRIEVPEKKGEQTIV